MGRVRLTPAGIARIHAISARAVARITRAVEADAERYCPVDEGDLKASIHSTVTGTTGRVWVGTDHWAPTEYGSRPHIIRSHGPWPLRNRKTGQVFGPVVRHPGTPQQAFMRRALYQRRRP